ncbi:hypothetical protein BJ508DRAFT_312650 [Ascobolus immersus RN42]|uniref:DUF6589 domain-containing protein n=1 Tax=Ascobolus immersus RN42 TaxID=1160509 RepID=A0A3N4HLN4_ASCIM|nr:hypothetical protein BJ508DRAFT_312650 [Ascobolus immersus RN42]
MAPPVTIESHLQRKLEYINEVIQNLGLESALNVFRLEIQDAGENPRTTRAGRIRRIIRNGDLVDGIADILDSPALKTQSAKTAIARDSILMDRVILPIVCTDFAAEIQALGKKITAPTNKITPEDLETFDIGALKDVIVSEAPHFFHVASHIARSGRNKDLDETTEEEEDTSMGEGSSGNGSESDPDYEPPSEEDEDEDDLLADGKEGKKKDRELMVIVALLILAMSYNKFANFLQCIVGYFFLTTGVPKRTTAVLSRMRITVSYETITRAVKRISDCLAREYRQCTKTELHVQTWDNMHRTYSVKKRLLHKSQHMSHETQPFILFMHPDSGLTEPLRMHTIDRTRATELNVHHFLLDYGHLKKVAAHHAFTVLWHKYTPDIQRILKAKNIPKPCFAPVYQLPIKKSCIYPLPTLKIDEGSIAGNLTVMNAIDKELGLNGDFYVDNNILQLTSGDWLTVRNTRKALCQRVECRSAADRREFVEPTIGPFHYQMAAQRCIMGNYWGSTKDISFLSKSAGLIRDNKVDITCKQFQQCDHLLNDIGKGHVLAYAIDFTGCHSIDEFGIWMKNNSWTKFWGMIEEIVERIFNPTLIQERRYEPGTTKKKKPGAPLALRDILMYQKLDACQKEGDVGRLEKVMKYFNVMFQGSNQFNYAKETIHLTACLELMPSWTFRESGSPQ